MNLLRRLLAPALVAILVLTGQQLAMARGQAMAAGEAVLCIGGVAVSVPVDAQGNPVGPAPICPDCSAHLFVASQGAVWQGRPVPMPTRQGFAATTLATVITFVAVPATARDPPSFVLT